MQLVPVLKILYIHNGGAMCWLQGLNGVTIPRRVTRDVLVELELIARERGYRVERARAVELPSRG